MPHVASSPAHVGWFVLDRADGQGRHRRLLEYMADCRAAGRPRLVITNRRRWETVLLSLEPSGPALTALGHTRWHRIFEEHAGRSVLLGRVMARHSRVRIGAADDTLASEILAATAVPGSLA